MWQSFHKCWVLLSHVKLKQVVVSTLHVLEDRPQNAASQVAKLTLIAHYRKQTKTPCDKVEHSY